MTLAASQLIFTTQTTATSQQIYLSPDGRILCSDDAIFETDDWSGVPVQDIFPVLESCYPYLFQPENVNFREFSLPAVQFERGDHPAWFDFYFLKIWFDSREAIFWWVEDRTRFYAEKQRQQQRRNASILGY